MLATISEEMSVSRLVRPMNQTLGATWRQVWRGRTFASQARKSPVQSKEYTGWLDRSVAALAHAIRVLDNPRSMRVLAAGAIVAMGIVGTAAVSAQAPPRLDLGSLLRSAGEKVE